MNQFYERFMNSFYHVHRSNWCQPRVQLKLKLKLKEKRKEEKKKEEEAAARRGVKEEDPGEDIEELKGEMVEVEVEDAGVGGFWL